LPKLHFHAEYSASADTFVALGLIIGKYKTTVNPKNSICQMTNDGERATERRQSANDVSL